MAASTSTKLLTVDEFYEQYAADERDLELVAGKVVAVPPPSWDHDAIAGEIYEFLRHFVIEHDLGRAVPGGGFLVRQTPDTVRSPDVSFTSRERLTARRSRRPYIEGGPDLAVEVVSPRNSEAAIRQKIAEYFSAATQRVWIVRAEPRTVTVHRPDGTARTHGADDTLTSDDAGFPVDGFELPVARVFA
jgi:Uma2 family endonuclease